jgi:Mg2+/citrate symporter
LDTLFNRVDAWMVALAFWGAMLTSWSLGRWSGRRFPPDSGQDPGMKFTDASMAILGLLLAFTFAMSLGRHDQRRLTVVEESNSIGDFYTCATLLKEPQRSALQIVIREHAQNELRALSRFLPKEEQQNITQRNQEMYGRMTDIVARAVEEGTPIAVSLTNTLNSVTSANASRLAAYDESLPWSIEVLLFLAAIVPSFLMGKQQAASQKTRLSGMLSFIILVTLVIFVILDLNQGRRGLIRVNREPFERLIDSIAK